MAARTRTASRSPTRRSASRRPKSAAVEVGNRIVSSISKVAKKTHVDRDLFDNPLTLPTYIMLATLTMVFVLSYALLMIGEQHNCLGKLCCPFLRKWILGSLGLANLKPRGLTVFYLGLYVAVTWIALTIATVVSIPVVNGVAPDMSAPRKQKGSLGGLPHRLAAAQSNMIEGLVMLLTSLVAANWAALPEAQIQEYTGLFVMVRMVYCFCYAMDWHRARSCMFMVGAAICGRLLHLATLKFS